MKCKTQLSKAIQNRIREETKKEFLKYLGQYSREVTVQLVFFLHFYKGYGEKRLKAFIKEFNETRDSELENYGFDDTETVWLFEKKLKDDGIDVDEIMGCDNE